MGLYRDGVYYTQFCHDFVATINEITLVMCGRDVNLASKLSQIGSKMGQIWDFLRGKKVLKLILKSPRFVPFWANLTQFVGQI